VPGREVALHHRVDRTAGQAGVAHRIPGPQPQGLERQQLALDLRRERLGVDRIVEAERTAIDPGQPILERVELGHALADPAGRAVLDLRVVGMEAVADRAGRREPGIGVEQLVDEPAERLVGGGRCGGGARAGRLRRRRRAAARGEQAT
jgi:hypothetical protein